MIDIAALVAQDGVERLAEAKSSSMNEKSRPEGG